MPLGEVIDDPTANDDYVAQLLASEAKDKSLKYSSIGLQAYLPRRPTDRAPKPNTRFLKNILRDTDSHNAALKRKEEKEARDRMRQLRDEKSSSSRRLHHKDRDYRDRSPRHLREERTSSGRSKSGSYRDRDDERRRRHRHRDGSSSGSDRETARSHRRHRDDDKRSRRARDYSKSPHRSSQHRRDENNDRHGRHRHSDRSRSRSPRPSRHMKDDQRTHRKFERPTSGNSNSQRHDPEPERTFKKRDLDDDSDPLEDLVGPLPASSRRKDIVASRGRGSYRENTSTIDSHFAHDYDPKLDVHLSEDEDSTKRSTRRPVAGLMTEEDDWDMALEALRDRAEWKKKGEERLRVAGFGGDVVDRWKSHPSFSLGTTTSHNTEENIEDVRWAKKGEGREWDRGKVMNEDGVYDVKAQW